jgi:hypothetical protein
MNNITVEWISKHPHTSRSLTIRYPVGKAPKPLFKDLERAGFFRPKFHNAPSVGGFVEVDYEKAGTDIFGQWKPAERRVYVAAVEKVLTRHGLTAKYRRLTIADCL